MADREVMLDFGLEEVLKSLSEFGISRALKWEQKGVIATLVTGKHLLAVLPTGFGKSLIFQVLVRVKETMTGTPSSVVVVFPLQSIVCDQMEEASSMGLTAATLTKSHLKDIECGICVSGGGFSEAISFLNEKRSHTVSSEYVCNHCG